MCPGCGAKQNPKHMHCPECGAKLPEKPLIVAKNHDFVCLGCGHDLDKGEKFCPTCGKENPGHNPMADQKIPANKDGAGKGRVLTKGKKGKKKAGKQTPGAAGGAVSAPESPAPTPAVSEGVKEVPEGAQKAAATEDAKPGPVKKAKKKPKGSKKLPPWLKDKDGDGDGDSDDDAKADKSVMPGDPEFLAALHLKALGVPPQMGIAHALTCPAYNPADVTACFPEASFATLDLAGFQDGALEKAAGGSLDEAHAAQALLGAVETLREFDPFALADLREGAHKMFRDANPGPGSAPHPGQISPQRFNRPYITGGHSAPSPGQEGPNGAKIPATGGIHPDQFRRGHLDSGHADDSPGNTSRPTPMPAPDRTGVPTGAPAQSYFRDSARESAQHAMRIMHDHITTTFPDLCVIGPDHPAPHPVPTPEGVPAVTGAPGARGLGKASKAERKAQKAAKAAKAAKAKARKARQAARDREARIARRVLKGALTLEDAQVKLGITPPPPEGTKAVEGAPPEPVPVPVTAEDLAAAVKTATAPLLKTIKRQGKDLRRVQKTADAIAGQPDTTGAPFRATALTKTTPAAPAGPPSVAKSAEQAQATLIAQLYDDWRNNPDPAIRKAAWDELYSRQMDPSMTMRT